MVCWWQLDIPMWLIRLQMEKKIHPEDDARWRLALGKRRHLPLFPAAFHLLISSLTKLPRSMKFFLSLKETNCSFALPNGEKPILKYALDFALNEALVLCYSLLLIRFRRHVSISTNSRYWALCLCVAAEEGVRHRLCS